MYIVHIYAFTTGMKATYGDATYRWEMVMEIPLQEGSWWCMKMPIEINGQPVTVSLYWENAKAADST